MGVKIDRPSVGQWETIVVPNVFCDGYAGPPEGSPGEYDVTFVFGQPIFQIGEMNISFDTEGGDSYVQMHDPDAPPEQQLTILAAGKPPNNGPILSARITANIHGRIAKASYEKVAANNRHEAEALTYQLLKPLLAWVSLTYDIPVDIIKIVTKELRNGNTSVTTWMSPPVVAISDRFTPPPMEAHLAECLNQYNEGNNSTNDFYRFLCFWKVFEAVEKVRGLISREVRNRGYSNLSLKRTNQIPNSPDFAVDVRGKEFTEIRGLFNDAYRNALAHLDFTRTTFVLHNSLGDVGKVREAIPVIRYIARTALREEIQKYGELCQAAGSSVDLTP